MFSNRVNAIKPFIVMEILEKALEMEANGIDIVHMEIGEPDFDTPDRIVNGCFSDIKSGKTHYTHSLGYIELRKALSDYKMNTRNIYFDPNSQFMVTGGTSPAYFNILSTIINPGDEVIITDPGYPCYENFITFFNGKPVFMKIYEENKFNLEIDELKKSITSKTKAIILNSPSNPTGQVIPHETLKEIAEIIEKKQIWAISDEIYSELTYDGELAPSLSDSRYTNCHDKLVVLDGFSKYWAMTGWRLGYIIAPPLLINEMIKVQQNFFICAPSISQAAALHALNCENETKEMLSIYKDRRDYIFNRLNKIRGIKCLKPKGAFYMFANIKPLDVSSMEFSLKLLDKAYVATCPGISFGQNGEGYVRISYPTDIKNIKIGMDRLETFIKEEF